MKKGLKIALCILCALVLFTGGALVVSYLTTQRLYQQLQLDPVTAKAAEVSAYLSAYYIDTYDETALADAAASAMVDATGDPWSYYLSAADYQSYEESMENAYVGIGITILASEEDGGFLIDDVTPGGPAAQAGILIGDVLFEIEGQDALSLGASGARALVRGEEGTTVSLKLRRGEEVLELAIPRARIAVDVATGRMLDGQLGYVKISNFDERCFDETSACIDALLAQGAKGLIFDVRFNGGGYRDELVKLLDKLLPEGILFQSEDYSGKKETDTSDASCLALPMAVLVNRESYSAAEFFAAALQEYDWAEVVGEKTTGKGRFQTGFRLSDGSLLNLSIGKYYTPQGRSLTDLGVTPDLEVALDEQAYLACYQEKLPDAEDAQLQGAIGILMDKIS